MTLPNVNVAIQDGGLGGVSAQESNVVVVIGLSSEGTDFEVSPTYTRKQTLVDDKGYGQGVEAAAFYIDAGIPTIFVKITEDSPGSCGGVTHAGTGASTLDLSGVEPFDDGEWIVEWLESGTIGTDTPRFHYSRDGGISFSSTLRMGTPGTYEVPGTNVTFTFSVGTVVKGDTYSFAATGPTWTGTDLTACFDALKARPQLSWRLIHVVGTMSAADAGTVDTAVQSWPTDPVFRYVGARVVCDARGFDGDTEADWMAALITDFGTFSSVDGRVAVGAGPTRIASAISGYRILRCASWHAVKKFMLRTIHTDISELVPITGLTDITGFTTVYHDEQVLQGLDEARFITIRSVPGRTGYFITNPNTMAIEGSDFSLMQYGFVGDVGAATYRDFFLTALNQPVRVDNDGHILEKDAQALEAGANAAVRSALVSPGHVSPSTMTQKFAGSIPGPTSVARDDNILSTKTLTVNGFIIPLGYTKFINVTFGFRNPVIAIAA